MARTREIALPWTQQPQEAVGAAAADRLVALLSPPTGEAVTRTQMRAAPSANRPNIGVNGAGQAWAFGGAHAIEAPSIPYAPPPFTLLLIARKSASVTEALVGFGGSGGGYGWRLGSYAGAAAMYITFGGVADYNISTSGWLVGEVACYALVCTASTAAAWCNGEKLGSVSVGTPFVPAFPLTLGASNGGAGDHSTSEINNVALYGRAFSDDEAAAASRAESRQWGLYLPITRRIPVYSAAPSAVPDITAVVAENILATSAGYRVSLNYA